ncbi:MAG: hypothetical protein ACYDHT_10150 [Solirubrobacteraceae bacterium]
MSELGALLAPFNLEIEALQSGETALDDPVSLTVGVEDGVVGLLDQVLQDSGTKLEFDPSRLAAAAELERRERRKGNVTLAKVLRVYRDVARMYPDVLGTGYGGTPEDFEEFRRLVVPKLLRAVLAWAKLNDEDSVDQLSALQRAWNECVDGLED